MTSMFKKLLVSTVLGVLLFSSFALWAKGNDALVSVTAPVQVAKLEVANQLSISAHQVGEESYIQQVGVLTVKVNHQHGAGMPMTTVSFLWLMAAALLFFVIRATTRRIK